MNFTNCTSEDDVPAHTHWRTYQQASPIVQSTAVKWWDKLWPSEQVQSENRCHLNMERKIEQRISIKFHFKSGKTGTETHEMLVQVYVVEAVSEVCIWVL